MVKHLSLIGMSNIGKSFCAQNLATQHGYKAIDCDAIIERKLGIELTKDGLAGIEGMAKWMGFPADNTYARNSRRYVDLEQEVMREAIATIQTTKEETVVLDTTGSVIYTDEETLGNLRATTCVVYFEASAAHAEALFQNFLTHPKPVIWHQSYKPRNDEPVKKTLERCYPELLQDRARRYKKIAHIVIPFEKIREHWTDIGKTVLQLVASS